MKLKHRSKLVSNVGVNDANYSVVKYKVVSGKHKMIWMCPYYIKWSDMLKRCYSPKLQKRQPTYKGCSVCNEWLTFSNFKAWMETQDWKDKQLDKDLLVEGNKVYSPETCVFVHSYINNFLIDRGKSRGSLPIGVSMSKGHYKAQCNDPFKIRSSHIGSFKTPEEAHQAWKVRKCQYSVELANSEHVTDERVRQVLLTKYCQISLQ